MRRALAIGLAASAVVAVPAMAQETARPVAGCVAAALDMQSRVRPETDAYQSLGDVAGYWRGELVKAQPDPDRQAALVAGAQEALGKDLATMSRTDGMMRVSQILTLCGAEREKREGKQ